MQFFLKKEAHQYDPVFSFSQKQNKLLLALQTIGAKSGIIG